MRYTSKYKLDFKEMKKSTLSDKAKKFIAELLLTSQILGTMPSFANNNEINEYNLQQDNFNIRENFSHRDIARDELVDKLFKQLDTIKEIDTTNLEEFSSRSPDNIIKDFGNAKKNFRLYNIHIKNFGKINEKILSSLKSDSLIELIPHNEDLRIYKIYSPKELLDIIQYYKTHYGEIINNPNLNEKEKFIACINKMCTLLSYDHEAVNKNSAYYKAAILTARNQYSATKYGKTVCVGYANSVKIIGSLLGIEIKEISTLLLEKTYNNLSEKEKNTLKQQLNNWKDIDITDHVANIVTFSDGTNSLLDITNHDYFFYKKNYDSKRYFLTNFENFDGALQLELSNGQTVPLILNAEDRKLAMKCKEIPRKEIKLALKKAQKEIPSLKIAQEFDEFQYDNNLDKQSANTLFKFIEKAKNWTNMLKDKIFGKKTPLLPEGNTNNIIYDDNLSEIHNNSENSNKLKHLNNKEEAILKRKDEIEDEINSSFEKAKIFRNMISNIENLNRDLPQQTHSNKKKRNEEHDIEK